MHLKFVPADRDHGWYYADENGQVILAQGQPIPVSVASEIAECVNAGWRPWHGGTIPADAVGRVDIQLRDGEIWQNRPSEDVIWRHVQTDADVVFWRPAPRGDWLSWLSATESDANSWHDIPELQMASQRPAVEWPAEDDHDPTLVMGGIYDPAKENAV